MKQFLLTYFNATCNVHAPNRHVLTLNGTHDVSICNSMKAPSCMITMRRPEVAKLPDMQIDLIHVLDAIPIGVCLIDKERRIIFINRALAALTGFSASECEGLPCSHVLRFNNCFENCPVNNTQELEGCVLEGDIIDQANEKIPVRVTFAPSRMWPERFPPISKRSTTCVRSATAT